MKYVMMSSSKQKGGRPGLASGQEAKQRDQSGRGTSRCPHVRSHQPLKGKSFYLDVRRQAAKLKKDLEDLGGVVETFLSKDVNYVVSDRPEVKLECSKNAGAVMPSGASPAVSTPSPFQQSKGSTHGAVDSPSASGGRVGMVTRGKAIVQKATISQTYGTSNVLANARNWNVSIRYIDSVIKYINKEKQKMKESGVKSPKTQAQLTKEKASTSKERKLSRPALKVEDASGHYRPASKELSSWPRVTFDGQAGSCPFDTAVHRDIRDKRTVDKQRDGTQHRPDDKGDEGEATQTRPSLKLTHRLGGKKHMQPLHTPSRQRDVGVNDNRRGYCECCLIKYSDLEKHLVSEEHRCFVRENNHYVNLDTMIDEGPNMEKFLDDVMQHHEWQRIEGIRSMNVIDEVSLVSSPSLKKRKKGPTQGDKHHQLGEAQDAHPDRPASPPHEVGQSTPHFVSPRRKAYKLQSAAVEDGVAGVAAAGEAAAGEAAADEAAAGEAAPGEAAPGEAAPGEAAAGEAAAGEAAAGEAAAGEAAAGVSCDDIAEPTPADKSHGIHSNQDEQACEFQDTDIVCELASIENNLREKHQRHLSGSQRSPGRHSKQQIQISSLTLEEASCQPPNDSGDKRLGRALGNSPETPHRKQSSRLSLSAKRRQIQKDTTSPTQVKPLEVMSPEVMSPEKDSVEQPIDQSRMQERTQVSEQTPNTANKRQRSIRLSLTAKKRLLKESNTDRCYSRKSFEDARISGDVVSSNVEERLKDSAKTDHCQEMETNKAVKDVDVGIPENQQQRGSNKKSNCVQRPFKRKRKSNDVQDLGTTKNPKCRVTDASYQAHIRQKTDHLSTSKEKTSEKHKPGGSIKLSETNPADAESSPQKRTGQDHTEDNRKQEPTQRTGSKHSTQQPNLESIFESDPNMVESSFLGFSTDDITETEQRLQQLSASSTMFTSKLQEAALNVCCIPSSELHLPEDDDSVGDSSEMSNMEEVVVGMALRNLANFPSDGSEWEANVGGFMSVRLDEAMQIKAKEAVLAQACMQDKENMKENKYRQILNIPSKLVPVDAMEQENVIRQLAQSHKTSQSVIKTVSPKGDARSKRMGNRTPIDSDVLLPVRALNYESGQNTRSHRRNTNLENRTNRIQSPLYDPLQVVSSSTGCSPVKSPKPFCSTPKRANKPPDDRKHKLIFSPDTPKEDREIILEHYIHDVTEDEIDFPKFSSPQQSDSIVSPIKHFAKSILKNTKGSCRSPYKLKAPRVLREFPRSGSPRKSLYSRRRNSTSSVPGRVFHFLLNPPGSPRKRDASPSLLSSPLKQSATNLSHSLPSYHPGGDSLHQITYFPVNERNKVSPTFCTNAKPNFSSHILHPGNKKRRSDRLRRPSNQSLVNHRLQRRPARTWSLCVSFDDDICCSDDVYEFIDDTKGDKEATCSSHQASPIPSATKDNKNRPPSQEDKTTRAADEAKRANSKSNSSKKDTQPSDSSENEVLQEFGLPFSFFM